MAEAYICDFARTPIGRYGGALRDVRTDDLGAIPIKALMERNGSVDWDALDDCLMGCANQAGEDNRNVARMAVLLAGLPTTVPGGTINRLCGSGLDAVGTAARAIKTGEADLMLAGGVESMTRAPFVMGKATEAFSRDAQVFDTTIGWRFVNAQMKKVYGTDAMPETGENVADEHPRGDTTLEMLAKLRTPFRDPGTVTAGNASGVNDGSAALIIASEDGARRHGLTPRARIVAMATAGVPPRIMGIGPAPAVQKLLAKLGMSIGEIDIIELNEAFASQGIAVLRQLGLADDAQHVNPHGGAIALGHPLGMSGARLALTAVNAMETLGQKRAIATMCIGVGQGIAALIERV